MKVIINGKEFTAELSETKAATEFSELLPLTFEMEELNGNEKCRYLLVIFYKSFETPYSYTRIGKILNPDGLEKAAGSWDAEVSFRE